MLNRTWTSTSSDYASCEIGHRLGLHDRLSSYHAILNLSPLAWYVDRAEKFYIGGYRSVAQWSSVKRYQDSERVLGIERLTWLILWLGVGGFFEEIACQLHRKCQVLKFDAIAVDVIFDIIIDITIDITFKRDVRFLSVGFPHARWRSGWCYPWQITRSSWQFINHKRGNDARGPK